MKKRITALLLAVLVLLALPASASAGPDKSLTQAPAIQADELPSPEPGVTPDAHQDGIPFLEWNANWLYGYNSFVQVCTYQWNTDFDNRVADAAAEWTAIGGELAFIYAGWSDSTCMANRYGTVVFVTSPSVVGLPDNLGDNTLGQTTCVRDSGYCSSGSGKVKSCQIILDMDNGTVANGAYTWYAGSGSPAAGQIDAESVLVHEFGHCVSLWGHANEGSATEDTVMDDTLNIQPFSNPEGVENDELWSHDMGLYISMYGNTH